jgi:hypothetical protein
MSSIIVPGASPARRGAALAMRISWRLPLPTKSKRCASQASDSPALNAVTPPISRPSTLIVRRGRPQWCRG